jgi:hypothetical protein
VFPTGRTASKFSIALGDSPAGSRPPSAGSPHHPLRGGQGLRGLETGAGPGATTVYKHYIVQFAVATDAMVDDTPTPEHMLATGRDALRALGLASHQAVIAGHADTEK